MEELFSNKESCMIYIPLEMEDKESFIVELLDTCEAYLEPLKYGLPKEDILDFLNLEKQKSLIDYLLYKKFIATTDDFKKLALRYGTLRPDGSIECLTIKFSGVSDRDIEDFFANHTISDILDQKFAEEKATVNKAVISKESILI